MSILERITNHLDNGVVFENKAVNDFFNVASPTVAAWGLTYQAFQFNASGWGIAASFMLPAMGAYISFKRAGKLLGNIPS